MGLFCDEYIKYILNKYLVNCKYDNIKKYILGTNVKLGDNNCKFLPGYTNIPLTQKPHHLDPLVRKWEEELFILHDLLHQLFPLNLNSNEKEYSDSQVMGELFVFMLTEYIIQNDLLNDQTIDCEYKKFILEIRGYYNKIKKLINLYGNINNVLEVLFIESKNEYIEDKLVNEIVQMFKIDYVNSKHNHKLLTKTNKKLSFCENITTIEDHNKKYLSILYGYEKPYINNNKIKLKREWI